MKKIQIRKIEMRNFRNHSSLDVDLPPAGIVASGFNGSGKSSILQGIMWVLGMTIPAEQILNSSTLAPASVEMVLSVDSEDIKLSRTLIPQKNEAGKVVASSSNYSINDRPEKATLYTSKVVEFFGTKDWIYLLNPSLAAQNKSNRNLLLSVAGCPSEKEFLMGHNPELAAKIGNTSFDDWQKQQERIVNDLSKKIQQIPGKTEELSALIQPVEEIDLTGIEERIKAINAELSGVDQINSEKQADYEKTMKEAQSLRNEATRLRGLANEKVMDENKRVNQAVFDAEIALQSWRNEKAKLTAQYDAVKSEIAEARTDLARAEARAQELYAEAMKHAEAHKQTSLRPIDSEKLGQCAVCNKWCGDLAARGAEAAEKQRTNELARIVEAGKQVMSLRSKELAKINEITDRIDSLMSKEHEIESKINALGEAPTAPERKVITETPESLHLIGQAQDLEATAEKLIKSNKLEVAQRPAELMDELQQLNEKLTRGTAIAQTRKNNDKINARIAELREEESALITTQLQHKQHIAQLKEFYKKYAESVTASVNKLFDNTGYEIRLFESNMGNDKGVPVMQPMKDGSTNLSTAEALIFNLRFVERVLMKHYKVQCPVLVDNVECVSNWGLKVVGKHQSIIALVSESPLAIHKLDWPKETQSQSK